LLHDGMTLAARGRKVQNRTNYRLNLLDSSPVFRLQDFCHGLLRRIPRQVRRVG
jgi:hypothetical protein